LVLLVPVMCLAAVPLGQVNPRQGRFGKLIPGILAYMLYMGMLLVIRSRIADVPEAEQSVFLNMAWVHALAIAGVVLLYAWPGIVTRWRVRRAGAAS
jgi:lipopolysaccharide export system permease protein